MGGTLDRGRWHIRVDWATEIRDPVAIATGPTGPAVRGLDCNRTSGCSRRRDQDSWLLRAQRRGTWGRSLYLHKGFATAALLDNTPDRPHRQESFRPCNSSEKEPLPAS